MGLEDHVLDSHHGIVTKLWPSQSRENMHIIIVIEWAKYSFMQWLLAPIVVVRISVTTSYQHWPQHTILYESNSLMSSRFGAHPIKGRPTLAHIKLTSFK